MSTSAGRRPGGVPPSPCLVMATASSFVSMVHDAHGRGPTVRMLLRRVGLGPGEPWGTAFVTQVGYRAHQIAGSGHSSWPLPVTGRARDLLQFALPREVVRPVGEEGDVSLIWTGEEPQAGFVTSVHIIANLEFPEEWTLRVRTIEANVTRRGVPGGPGIFHVERELPRGRGALFVNWSALDGRRALTDGTISPVLDVGRGALRWEDREDREIPDVREVPEVREVREDRETRDVA